MTRRYILILAACLCFGQDIQVDVGLVTVSVSVSDRDGAPVQNLRREDFKLLDAGKAREIQYFWQEADVPLTIGLIADVSGSQLGAIKGHREKLTRFLSQVMGPRDQAFLVTVGAEPKLVTDFTSSVETLGAAVEALPRAGGTQFGEPCGGFRMVRLKPVHGCGGTALWNGVWAAARLKMKSVSGRKALIVLSDGFDTGSTHSLTDAIEAAQSADTLVYTIQSFGATVYASPVHLIMAGVNNGLRRLSSQTGGRAYFSPRNPEEVFKEIEDELRNLYILGFTPPENVRDGKFHKLEVKASRKDLRVRARRGYQALPSQRSSN